MDAEAGENAGEAEQITDGDWTGTHTLPMISEQRLDRVFSSNHDRPADAPERDHGLDPGYFVVTWHVNHPVFSPDGQSIAVTSDLAAVSTNPMSPPIFLHSVRPYCDIFTVDIDPDDMEENQDVEKFARVTHNRYENSTPAWSVFSTHDPHAQWNLLVMEESYTPSCPYAN
ncbi:hypothetical protein CFC21_052042 [Triticum aestivum]|uniref:Uncharacterized protein n=3 Tax=Triticum TaxID=4564 RepID=A0A9R0VWT1_TRITD|nr:hypothetical protein CFC21_052042 [Triticum aestivum]VAH90126.1 unnamed protein product [Triticum turgidum subsp. durum]